MLNPGEMEKKLKKNDNIILAAFGGGFTWGAVYLKWGYSSQKSLNKVIFLKKKHNFLLNN